jgi:hypothetical protein
VETDEMNAKLYFKKGETVRYKVYEPEKEEEAVVRDYSLEKYYEVDMRTEDVQLVLTVGLPHSNELTLKTGCFGRKTKTTVDKIYEEVPYTAN